MPERTKSYNTVCEPNLLHYMLKVKIKVADEITYLRSEICKMHKRSIILNFNSA